MNLRLYRSSDLGPRINDMFKLVRLLSKEIENSLPSDISTSTAGAMKIRIKIRYIMKDIYKEKYLLPSQTESIIINRSSELNLNNFIPA